MPTLHTFYLVKGVKTGEIRFVGSPRRRPPALGKLLPLQRAYDVRLPISVDAKEGASGWKVVKVFEDELLSTLQTLTQLDEVLGSQFYRFVELLVAEVSEAL
jgi:hypothetical protein